MKKPNSEEKERGIISVIEQYSHLMNIKTKWEMTLLVLLYPWIYFEQNDLKRKCLVNFHLKYCKS